MVCPLDWGLGHTARCVPLIKFLQGQGNHIVVGCNSRQQEFLRQEISDAEFVDLFGYEVKYSKTLPLWMKLAFQFPRLMRVVRKENEWLKNFISARKKGGNPVDIVISDNRFGLFSEEIESVLITHQVHIQAPVLSVRINYLNHAFIKKFNQCWIPDNEGTNSLAGKLTGGKKVNKNTIFIGPLSRLEKQSLVHERSIDVLLLLSGVEPQRSILEEKLIASLKETDLKIVLVRGTNSLEKKLPGNFSVINTAHAVQLEELIRTSKNIVCRPGYSTLMDLHAMGRNALLIPTPGQTEQEYLAGYWKEKFGCPVLKQDNIDERLLLTSLSLKDQTVQT